MGNKFWDMAITIVGGVGSGLGFTYTEARDYVAGLVTVDEILGLCITVVMFTLVTVAGATISYMTKKLWDKIFNKKYKK